VGFTGDRFLCHFFVETLSGSSDGIM